MTTQQVEWMSAAAPRLASMSSSTSATSTTPQDRLMTLMN